MESILLSIHAKWCAKIMNGEKGIEVRKGTALYKAIQKLIDKYGYADFYVYCTKDEWLLYKNKTKNEWDILKLIKGHKLSSSFNGKVPFKFRCYKVEEIFYNDYYECFMSSYLDKDELCEKSCVSQEEMFDYFKTSGGNCGTAIHIGDLEIFDKPKELSEFGVKYSPQSFMYIEVE